MNEHASTSLERTLARVQWAVVALIAIATVTVGGVVGAYLSLRQDDATSLALAHALVKELDNHAADTPAALENEIRSELGEQAAFGREVAIYKGARRVGATDVGLLIDHTARFANGCATKPLQGRRWRVCNAVSATDADVYVAAPLDRLTSATELLAIALIVAALGTSALFGLLSRRIVRRVIKPFDELRRGVTEIQGIRSTELSFASRWRVTEVDSVAEAFDELLTRVARAIERERRFVADASHELRTPLTSIRGQLELLTNERDVNSAAEMLRGAQRSCDLLVRTTESLLALARDEASLTETVDLCESVVEVEDAQATVRGEAILERIIVEAAEQVLVRGDPQLLRLAVNNLVDNALKYTDGRIAVRVKLGSDHGKPSAQLTVEDEGAGIPEEEIAQLVRPFARGATTRQKGTGLGLALVEHVARVHGGRLELGRSQWGGLRAVIVIPPWTPTAPR